MIRRAAEYIMDARRAILFRFHVKYIIGSQMAAAITNRAIIKTVGVCSWGRYSEIEEGENITMAYHTARRIWIRATKN